MAALKANGARQDEMLPADFRPRGWYESLVVGDRFQVRRIHVHPGKVPMVLIERKVGSGAAPDISVAVRCFRQSHAYAATIAWPP